MKELSTETMGRIVKLIQEDKPQWCVVKDVSCFQSSMFKNKCTYRRNVVVKKGKHSGRPQKTLKCQDRKLKAICLLNRKDTTKQMKNKWVKT